MSSPLYPCSACNVRYAKNNINELNDCCFQTCAQFIEGGQQKILESECGQKCLECARYGVYCRNKTLCSLNPKIPSIRLQPKHFKECLAETNTPENALQCCFNKSTSNEQQENCINAYNALVPVKEDFIFKSPFNRCALFLAFIIIFNLLQVNKIIRAYDVYTILIIYICVYLILLNI